MRTLDLATVAYWVTTALVAAALFGGGAADAVHAPSIAASIAHLGDPAYFSTLIGVWKMLGALALVAPRLPRVKEWAYAGVFFDLSGAAISHAAIGDGPRDVIVPLVLAALAVASWSLRPESRRLGVATPARAA